MSDDETQVIVQPLPRPDPGGRLSARAAPGVGEWPWQAAGGDRLRPLLAAAAPLLDLCVRIKNSPVHDDVEGLRLGVLREIDRFERQVAPLGLAPRAVRASKYALCATVDDLVFSTPWGSRSIWTSRSMVGTLFSETWGGDRFFDLVEQLKKDPGLNVDLLELLYCCLSLGFEGKTRVASRGSSEHANLREDLYRLIRAGRGEFERDISPHWRGLRGTRRGPGAFLPFWVAPAVAGLALVLLYAAFSLTLGRRADGVADTMAVLPPTGVVTLARAARPPPPPVFVEQGDRLRRFLEPEIREGLVTVREDAQTIAVTIRGAGMFGSGEDTVLRRFEPLLARIGTALNDQPGQVRILGHTDSQPIRSLAFPSNQELSLARAKTVARLVQAPMREPGRVTVDGAGATQPIADNATAAGRGENRRTEIIISKLPGGTQP